MREGLLHEIISVDGAPIPFEKVGEPSRERFDGKATSEKISEHIGKKAHGRANAYHLSYIPDEKPFRGYSLMDLISRNISQEEEADVQLYHIPQSEK